MALQIPAITEKLKLHNIDYKETSKNLDTAIQQNNELIEKNRKRLEHLSKQSESTIKQNTLSDNEKSEHLIEVNRQASGNKQELQHSRYALKSLNHKKRILSSKIAEESTLLNQHRANSDRFISGRDVEVTPKSNGAVNKLNSVSGHSSHIGGFTASKLSAVDSHRHYGKSSAGSRSTRGDNEQIRSNDSAQPKVQRARYFDSYHHNANLFHNSSKTDANLHRVDVHTYRYDHAEKAVGNDSSDDGYSIVGGSDGNYLIVAGSTQKINREKLNKKLSELTSNHHYTYKLQRSSSDSSSSSSGSAIPLPAPSSKQDKSPELETGGYD